MTEENDGVLQRGLSLALVLFAVGALFSARIKLLSFDELLVYYTASVPTAAAVLKVQDSSPVSLDPPAYHLMAHAIRLLPLDPALAVRLPSFAGFILMAICVFLFSRRIAGAAAGVYAVGLLLFAQTSAYAAEARPYGLIMGLSALALLLWQNAKHQLWRTPSLIGLFLTLGLAISSHYFGVLLALPLLLGEIYDGLRKRRLDIASLTAILGSYLFVLAWIPFLKAASQYREHYYTRVNPIQILNTYFWLVPCQGLSARQCILFRSAGLLSLLLLAVIGVNRAFTQSATKQRDGAAWAAVIALAFMPIAGVALAMVTSGAFQPRFVLEFAIGLAIASGCGLAAISRPGKIQVCIAAALLTAATLRLASEIRMQQQDRAQMADLMAAFAARTHDTVYSTAGSLVLYFYGERSSPAVRFTGLYDMPREIAWDGKADTARIAGYLHSFASLREISYNKLTAGPPRFEMECSTADREWACHQLQQDGASFLPQTTVGTYTLFSTTITPAIPAKP